MLNPVEGDNPQAFDLAKWLKSCPKEESDKYIAGKIVEIRKRYKQILIETLMKQKRQ